MVRCCARSVLQMTAANGNQHHASAQMVHPVLQIAAEPSGPATATHRLRCLPARGRGRRRRGDPMPSRRPRAGWRRRRCLARVCRHPGRTRARDWALRCRHASAPGTDIEVTKVMRMQANRDPQHTNHTGLLFSGSWPGCVGDRRQLCMLLQAHLALGLETLDRAGLTDTQPKMLQ